MKYNESLDKSAHPNPLIRSRGEGWRPCVALTGLITCIAGSIFHCAVRSTRRLAVRSVQCGLGCASRGLPANTVDFVLSSIGRQAICLGKGRL
ncbi:hypothetical protein BDW59DRAFT_5047 [Aspergillus cavernicola]|uniref:Uncharacterized protein n=1 Tax=Aspergillus cavernicola TaxID=176166 RepID=A0ABR4J830_9EURO